MYKAYINKTIGFSCCIGKTDVLLNVQNDNRGHKGLVLQRIRTSGDLIKSGTLETLSNWIGLEGREQT